MFVCIGCMLFGNSKRIRLIDLPGRTKVVVRRRLELFSVFGMGSFSVRSK